MFLHSLSSARSISMSRPRSSQWMESFLTTTPWMSSLGMRVQGLGVRVQCKSLCDYGACEFGAILSIGPLVVGLWWSGLRIQFACTADDFTGKERFVRVQQN